MTPPLITDDMIWADIAARIESHRDIAPPTDDDLRMIVDMVAEHFEVDRDRAFDVWADKTFEHRVAAVQARVA